MSSPTTLLAWIAPHIRRRCSGGRIDVDLVQALLMRDSGSPAAVRRCLLSSTQLHLGRPVGGMAGVAAAALAPFFVAEILTVLVM